MKLKGSSSSLAHFTGAKSISIHRFQIYVWVYCLHEFMVSQALGELNMNAEPKRARKPITYEAPTPMAQLRMHSSRGTSPPLQKQKAVKEPDEVPSSKRSRKSREVATEITESPNPSRSEENEELLPARKSSKIRQSSVEPSQSEPIFCSSMLAYHDAG